MRTVSTSRNLILGVPGYGAGDLVLTEVRVTDASGEDQLTFGCGQTAIIVMAARAVRAVRQPNLGFALVRPDGELVFAISNKNLGLLLPDMAQGEVCTVRFRVELSLATGPYRMSVIAGDTHLAPSGDSGTHHDTRDRLGPIVIEMNAAAARFKGLMALPVSVRIGGSQIPR